MMLSSRLLINGLLGLVIFSVVTTSPLADTSSSIELDNDIEIDIRQFGADASIGIIWFACNQGEDSIEFETARKLIGRGYKIYFPDMLSAHFLSPLPSNVARVPAQEVVEVIKHIVKTTSAERIYLVAGARAAVPVIRGLANPDLQQPGSKLKGALLITPRILKKRPEPGSEPMYIDETGLSVHPLIVLEGERTPNRWGLPHLSAALAKSGSKVRTELIKGVRGYFYLRNDQNAAEVDMTRKLDVLIHDNIQKFGSI